MVDLSGIRNGDTVVVEVEVEVFTDGSVRIPSNTIRFGDGSVNEGVKVLEHKPKPVPEPTGIGAVVKLRPKTGNHPHQYIIVNSGSSCQPWFMRGYNNLNYTWKVWMETYDAVEILSPGVEVDTA